MQVRHPPSPRSIPPGGSPDALCPGIHPLALISRKLLDFSPDSVGTFATVFPSDDPHHPGTPTVPRPTGDPFAHPPPLFAGEPFSLQQYYARYEHCRGLSSSLVSSDI